MLPKPRCDAATMVLQTKYSFTAVECDQPLDMVASSCYCTIDHFT